MTESNTKIPEEQAITETQPASSQTEDDKGVLSQKISRRGFGLGVLGAFAGNVMANGGNEPGAAQTMGAAEAIDKMRMSQELRRDEFEGSKTAYNLFLAEIAGAENLRVIQFGEGWSAAIMKNRGNAAESVDVGAGTNASLEGGNTIVDAQRSENGITLTFSPESPMASNGPLTIQEDETLTIFPDYQTSRNNAISAKTQSEDLQPARYSFQFFSG